MFIGSPFFLLHLLQKNHKKNCGNWEQKERKGWCNTRTWERDRREESKGQRSQRAPPLLLFMPLPRIATLFDLTLSIWLGKLTLHFSSIWTTLLPHNAVSKNAMHVFQFFFVCYLSVILLPSNDLPFSSIWTSPHPLNEVKNVFYVHISFWLPSNGLSFFIHLNKCTTT